MISKCQNIVINRTKFSEFEEFHPETQVATGVKLVGFVDSIDPYTGQNVKKNIAISYADVKADQLPKRPDNLLIDDLYSYSDPFLIAVPTTDPDGKPVTRYTVTPNFDGDFIQINKLNTEDYVEKFFSNGYFNIAVEKEIPFGESLDILLANFPASKYGVILRQITPGSPQSAGAAEILIEKDEKLFNNTSYLIRLSQVAASVNSSAIAPDDNSLRKIVATQIQIVN